METGYIVRKIDQKRIFLYPDLHEKHYLVLLIIWVSTNIDIKINNVVK